MKNLIGKRCSCVFDLPSTDWPIPGYPAWVRVLAWEPPMVEMAPDFGGSPMWLNASLIKTIMAVE